MNPGARPSTIFSSTLSKDASSSKKHSYLSKSEGETVRDEERNAADEESALGFEIPSERTALLGENPDMPCGALDGPNITTTWQREAKLLTKSSAPLILTFMLQYSLPVASIFTVGHIGKTELGAVSLATSKSRTIYSPYTYMDYCA